MNSDIELNLLKEIEELKRKVNLLEGNAEQKIPVYQYSKIRDADLKKLFTIESYNEEDLKINFIAPILNKIRFKSYEKNIRAFYELQMTYQTNKFILTGTIDFAVSEGLVESKKPYFFIQEFKISEEYGNPRPQLLAELISAVELNDWRFIKGAYIIGGNWHFAILEKLALGQYQYFISQNFDSTKIEDLKLIYKNLLFVKNEIIASVELQKTKATPTPT